MIKTVPTLLLILSLMGCSSLLENQHENNQLKQSHQVQINQTLFHKEAVKLVAEEDILRLSNEQKKEFLAFYQKELLNNVKPHQALDNFMSTRLSNFTFYGDTLIASESMKLNKGNCMSLAILTTALARTVNLEVEYREVSSLPIFEKHEQAILVSSHLQSVIYDPTFVPEEDFFYFNRPSIVIDYFPATSNWVNRRLLKRSLIAQYYINIAAQHIVNDDLNSAFANAELAYQYDNSSSKTDNLLAILHRKKGDLITAEKFYLSAINKKDTNLNVLQNYAIFLNSQQRFDELKNLNQKMKKFDDPNPYVWLDQAYLAQNKNDLQGAEIYFKKVITMAPYVHQAYLGLAQVYYAKGHDNKAMTILKNGIEWAHKENDRELYQRKLYSLSNI